MRELIRKVAKEPRGITWELEMRRISAKLGPKKCPDGKGNFLNVVFGCRSVIDTHGNLAVKSSHASQDASVHRWLKYERRQPRPRLDLGA